MSKHRRPTRNRQPTEILIISMPRSIQTRYERNQKKKGLPELVKFIFSILPTQLVKFIYYTILLMILIPSPIDILVTTQKPCFSRGMNLRALGIWAIGRKWLVSLRYPTKKNRKTHSRAIFWNMFLQGSYSQWSIYCTSIYYDLLMWSSLFQWFLWPQYPNISKHPFSDSLRKNLVPFQLLQPWSGHVKAQGKGRCKASAWDSAECTCRVRLKVSKWWTIGNGERGSMWTIPYPSFNLGK